MEGESERMQYGNAGECRDRKMEIERGVCGRKIERLTERERETNGESKSRRKYTVRGRKREREKRGTEISRLTERGRQVDIETEMGEKWRETQNDG